MDTTDELMRRRKPLQLEAWNPYNTGAGIGLLSILAFFIVDKPLGMSTEVSKLSGWLASIFAVMFISGIATAKLLFRRQS